MTIEQNEDLLCYLRVFLSIITSSFKFSEQIQIGKFKLKTEDNKITVESFKTLLNLMCIFDKNLNILADCDANEINKEMNRLANENLAESFNYSEIESIAEFVCVSYVHENEDIIKERIYNEDGRKGSRSSHYNPFAWLTTKLDYVKKAINLLTFDSNVSTTVQKYLLAEYSNPAQTLAYKDAWTMIGIIANGTLIEKVNGVRQTISRDKKIDKMINILERTERKVESIR